MVKLALSQMQKASVFLPHFSTHLKIPDNISMLILILVEGKIWKEQVNFTFVSEHAKFKMLHDQLTSISFNTQPHLDSWA